MKKIIISVLFSLAVQANAYGQVDPKIHNLCRDTIDYMGCVKANKKNNNWNPLKKNNKSYEVKIKGIYCGSDKFMKFLRTNYPLEEIYTSRPESEIMMKFKNDDEVYGYYYLFDNNSGQIYQESWESSDEQFVVEHLYMNSFPDEAYIFESKKIKSNILKIKTSYYKDGNLKDSWLDNINLSTLRNNYQDLEEKGVHVCMFYPLPENTKVIDWTK